MAQDHRASLMLTGKRFLRERRVRHGMATRVALS
jgi:hypothetical protein